MHRPSIDADVPEVEWEAIPELYELPSIAAVFLMFMALFESLTMGRQPRVRDVRPVPQALAQVAREVRVEG